MKRKRMKTYSPNYKLAEQKALEFIRLLEKKELPVKLIRFKKIFNDLEIKTYTWYSKKMGLTLEKVCEDLGSEDGCCVYNDVNAKYRIYYNDTIENEGRKRWTLAHELGHYAMKHNEVSGRSTIQRFNIPYDEYNVLEKEANCFARNLLAPPHVVFNIKGMTPTLIQNLCNVSLEASLNIFNFFKNGLREFGRGYSKEYAEELGFSKFLFNVNNRYYCRECKSNFILEKPKHCPGCGNSKIKKTEYLFGDDINMIYSSFLMDNEMRVIQCPQCGNDEVSGNYCKICATYLFNICTGIEPGNDDPYYRQGIQWGKHNQGCDGFLYGNARFCHNCGSTSSFFVDNLLKPWHTEEEEQRELVSTDGNPFDDSDNELPF